jgi:4-alpha-glucanotransferase
MTPQEISDYKQAWHFSGKFHTYHTHTDVRSEVVAWCKAFSSQEQWHINRYVEAYTDRIEFEKVEQYEMFREWYKLRMGA